MTIRGNYFLNSQGTVKLAAVNCPIYSWSNTQIICTYATGQGNAVSVYVYRSDGETSPKFSIYYSSPRLDNMSPSSADSESNSVITLSGWSIKSSSVFVSLSVEGSTLPLITPLPHSEDYKVSFILPPGVGKSTTVQLVRDGISGNTLVNRFRYNPPIITSIFPPSGPTRDLGTTLTVQGKNFGTKTDASSFHITIGGKTCEPTSPNHLDGLVYCYVPGGYHTSPQEVALSFTYVDGTTDIAKAPTTWVYNTPTVVKVRGTSCSQANSGNNLPKVTDCSNGGSVITIFGQDFGPEDESLSLDAPLRVFVGGVECPNVDVRNNPSAVSNPPYQQEATCDMGAGAGFDLDVEIKRGSKSFILADAVSYLGPSISQNTLRIVGDPDPPTAPGDYPVLASSTTGGDLLEFSGDFTQWEDHPFRVVYGPPRSGNDLCAFNPTEGTYSCDVQSKSGSSVICMSTPGVGKALTFQLCIDAPCEGNPSEVCTTASKIGLDTYTYPVPTITNGTLHRKGDPVPASTDPIRHISLSGQPETIQFNGDSFGVTGKVGPKTLSVKYGSDEFPNAFECQVLYDESTDEEITCITSQATGENYTFTVTSGYDSTSQSVRGFDSFSYPIQPEIDSVSGCTVDPGDSTRTTACTTSALESDGSPVILTISGKNFGVTTSDVRVKVGSALCENVRVTKITEEIECQLPPGTGQSLQVVITVDGENSLAVEKLDYALPVISKISSVSQKCASTNSNLKVEKCPRQGSFILVLEGTNFGTNSSTVIVGGIKCLSTVHDLETPSEKVYCTAPPGSQPGRVVILVQDSGDINTDSVGVVSYLPCSTGHYEVAGSTTCGTCVEGTYTDIPGKTSCTECNAGEHAPVVASKTCFSCPPGSFADDVGLPTCTACLPGTYAGSSGTVTCDECPIGSYATNNASQECTQCEPGSHQGETGQDHCDPCQIGRFTGGYGQQKCTKCPLGYITDEIGKSECKPCPAGSTTVSSGQYECVLCPEGYEAPDEGSPECLKCPIGTYAPSDGTDNCLRCEPGYFNDEPGASECKECIPGEYQNEYGANTCLECSSGRYSNTSRASGCEVCPEGTFQDMLNQTECIKCPAGQFTSTTENTQCQFCEPGQYTAIKGQVSCSTCLEGHEGNNPGDKGSTGCNPCLSGSFSSAPGSPECLKCGSGTYAPLDRAVSCSQCPVGHAQSERGESECESCNAGSYAGTTGLDECDLCPQGTFQDTRGQSACTECAPGTHAPERGMTRCLDCENGLFTNDKGSVQCAPCIAGTYANDTGMSRCFSCGVGTFSYQVSNVMGSSNCSACSLGTHAPREAMNECVLCPKGRFANESGLADCHAAPKGAYQPEIGMIDYLLCPNGTFQDAEGKSECQKCLQGWFEDGQGATECQRCPPGEFASVRGSASCEICPAGKSASSSASKECTPCDAGEFQPLRGQDSCDPCAKGTAQSQEGSTFCSTCPNGTFAKGGAVQCRVCPVGTVSPDAGQSECSSCDSHSTPDVDRVTCICKKGYYLPQSDQNSTSSDTSLIKCKRCSEGMDCDSYGTTWAALKTVDGYWRPHNQSFSFYRCNLPRHCQNGRPFECDSNREGPLCALCIEGYRASTGRSACEACPSQGQSIAVSIILSLLILFALLLLYYVVLRTDQHLLDLSKEREREEVEWDQSDRTFSKPVMNKSSSGILNTWQTTWTGNQDDNDLFDIPDETFGQAPNRQMEEFGVEPLAPKVTNAPSITHKMKILIGFFQIVTSLAFNVEVPYPSHYRSFIAAFQFFSLDFVPWQSLGCATLFDFYDKMIVTALTPIAIFLLILFFFVLPIAWIDRRDLDDPVRYHSKRRRASAQFWKLTLFTIFLMWPNVCRVTLAMFACKEVEGTHYVLEDMSLECYTERWYKYMWPALVMVLLYPIGVPLFFYYQLRSNRSRLTEPDVRIKIGFLYEAYSGKAWFFELMDMANKLALVSLIGFLPLLAQLPSAMAVISTYTISILLIQPYIRKGDDRLHLLANVEILLLLLSAFVLLESEKDNGTLDERTDILASAVLIMLTCGFIVAFLLISGLNIKKIVRNVQRKNAQEKHENEFGTGTELVAFHDDELKLEFVRDDKGTLLVESQGQQVGIVDQDDDNELVIKTAGTSMHLNPLFAVSSRDQRTPSLNPYGDEVGEGEALGDFDTNTFDVQEGNEEDMSHADPYDVDPYASAISLPGERRGSTLDPPSFGAPFEDEPSTPQEDSWN